MAQATQMEPNRETPPVVWIRKDSDIIPISTHFNPKLVLDAILVIEKESIIFHVLESCHELPHDIILHIFSFIPPDLLYTPELLLMCKPMYRLLTSPASYHFVSIHIEYSSTSSHLSEIMNSILKGRPHHKRDAAKLYTSANCRMKRMRRIWREIENYVSTATRSNLMLPCNAGDLEALRKTVASYFSLPYISIPLDVMLSWSIHNGESSGSSVLGVGLACSIGGELACVLGFARLLSINEIILTLKIHDPDEYKQISERGEMVHLLPLSAFTANKELCVDLITGAIYHKSGWNVFRKADNLLEYFYDLMDIPMIQKYQRNELPQIL